jgi:prepilin signal peptidase PulO-like enzyme (type II secretory pathway)
MAEPDVSPKLLSSTTGNTDGYAPISWTAVAALAVAVAFVVVTVVLAITSFSKQQSLIEPRLLVLPVFVVILAFVARRQILGSEGTRAGLRYANLGWYIAVVGGLTYATYLFAIEFAVRNDAEREFLAFSAPLGKLDAANAQDPALYAAIYAMIPPGARSSVANSTDAVGMDAGFKDLVLNFRSTDLARVCTRNPGRVAFKTTGLIDWDQKPRLISCTIKARMSCPEGDFDLVVPMRAEIEDNRQRRWMIVPSKEGYVKGRKLTPYGWFVEGVEQSGRQFASDMMYTLSKPGAANIALAGYVLPDSDMVRTTKLAEAVMTTTPGRMAVAGSMGIWPAVPPGAEQALTELFARPDGKPLTDNDRRTFRDAWTNPQRLTPAGIGLKSNTDTATQLTFSDGKVKLSHAAELVLSQEGQPAPTARAKVLLQVGAGAEAELVAELNRFRDAAATDPKLDAPSAEIIDKSRAVPWRVTGMVWHFNAVGDPRAAPPGGPPGGGGGMMGGGGH